MEKTAIDRNRNDSFGCLVKAAMPFKNGYILSVLLAIVGVFFKVMPFILISQMITVLVSGERSLSVYSGYLGVMAFSYGAEALFAGISTNVSHRACFKTLAAVRTSVLNKMFTLPLGYVKSRPVGELKVLVIDRIEALEPTLAHLVPEMTANLIVPLFVLAYMFVLDWRAALLSLAILPAGILLIMFAFKDYDKNFQTQISLAKKVNAALIEYMNGLEVIKIFNHGSRSFQKFSDTVEENASFSINWWKQITYWTAGAQVIWSASLLFVLPFGLLFVKNGSLEISRFLQLVILTLSWVTPILAASKFTDQLSSVKTTAKEIFDCLDEPDLIRPENKVTPENNSIELEQVHFSYGGFSNSKDADTTEVLKGISFQVEEKKKVALVGPSGGGKSTVGKLISGFWDTTGGMVKIGNKNIKELSVETLANYVSCVDQDIFLFNTTIRENLCLGHPCATERQMVSAAKAAYCHDFIRELPEGYDTVVGDRGSHLSGGERQRIALARAILKDAPIIILDEATAYFDPDSEAIIDEAVSELTKDKTLIVIAHRLSTIIDADHIILIENGRIADQGTHAELLKKSALYGEMWSAHMGAKEY